MLPHLTEFYFSIKLIPSLKYFEKQRNRTIIGNVKMTDAAYIGPGNAPIGLNCVEINTFNVCISILGEINISHINSLHRCINIDKKTIVVTDFVIGKAIVAIILKLPAPSILAASKTASGSVLK